MSTFVINCKLQNSREDLQTVYGGKCVELEGNPVAPTRRFSGLSLVNKIFVRPIKHVLYGIYLRKKSQSAILAAPVFSVTEMLHNHHPTTCPFVLGSARGAPKSSTEIFPHDIFRELIHSITYAHYTSASTSPCDCNKPTVQKTTRLNKSIAKCMTLVQNHVMSLEANKFKATSVCLVQNISAPAAESHVALFKKHWSPPLMTAAFSAASNKCNSRPNSGSSPPTKTESKERFCAEIRILRNMAPQTQNFNNCNGRPPKGNDANNNRDVLPKLATILKCPRRQRQISECSEDDFICFVDDGNVNSPQQAPTDLDTDDDDDLNSDDDSSDYDSSSYDSESEDDEVDDDEENPEDDSQPPSERTENKNKQQTTRNFKKVRFNLKPKVHTMHMWDYAYRAARKGNWEDYARDRTRFQQRIQRTAVYLDPVLSAEHRNKVFQSRFAEDQNDC